MPSGSMIIFVEFPVLHWHFGLVLNESMMAARAIIKVYMFHGYQFYSLVMSPFFHPHEPYDDITVHNVWSLFHPSMHPIDRESNSNTRLTPTYSVEFDLLEVTFPSVIWSTSNSSSSAASQAPHPRHGRGFIYTCMIPRGCGWARGGGHGDDTSRGFENGFVPFWGWGMMRDSTCGVWMRA